MNVNSAFEEFRQLDRLRQSITHMDEKTKEAGMSVAGHEPTYFRTLYNARYGSIALVQDA